MKDILLTLCISLMFLGFAQAHNYPQLLNTKGIEVIALGDHQILTEVHFEHITENLVFNAKAEVMAIQIFNDKEECILQLPIMAKEIKINKGLIGKGHHNVGFVTNKEIYFASVSIETK